MFSNVMGASNIEVLAEYLQIENLQASVTALCGQLSINSDKDGSFISQDQMLDAASVYE